MRIVAAPDAQVNHTDRALWLTIPFDRIWQLLAHLIVGDNEVGGMVTGDGALSNLSIGDGAHAHLLVGSAGRGHLAIADDLVYDLEVG